MPFAFGVMPYGLRPTRRVGPDVPQEIDFDRLWFDVYFPVLKKLGYLPVRADGDSGSMIVTEMLQRLVLGDLVVADITLSNANVYYEVGIRQAARNGGCVLAAADWAQPDFDLRQLRQVRYRLTDGHVGKATAQVLRRTLNRTLPELAAGGSPVHAAVKGYPEDPDEHQLSVFADQARERSAFDADVRAAFAAPLTQQRQRALAVLARWGRRPVIRRAETLALMGMLRDLVGWQAVLDFVASLPPEVRQDPVLMEQESLAVAKSGLRGAPEDAVGRLLSLIEHAGVTSERCGLLGGRYKQLMNEATDADERRRYLNLAIDAYTRGMMTDLNDYYPTSNLPRLYYARAETGDNALATEAAAVAMAACRRAMTKNTTDVWVRPTLLGLAFDRGDVEEAERVLGEVRREGPVPWRLATTLVDLRASVSGRHGDGARRALMTILAELEALLPPVSAR